MKKYEKVSAPYFIARSFRCRKLRKDVASVAVDSTRDSMEARLRLNINRALVPSLFMGPYGPD